MKLCVVYQKSQKPIIFQGENWGLNLKALRIANSLFTTLIDSYLYVGPIKQTIRRLIKLSENLLSNNNTFVCKLVPTYYVYKSFFCVTFCCSWDGSLVCVLSAASELELSREQSPITRERFVHGRSIAHIGVDSFLKVTFESLS